VTDLEHQLELLRARVARIDRKYAPSERPAKADLPEPSPWREKPAKYFIEEWSDGQVVENEHGPHFEMERHWASHRRHGSADIGALAELPASLLDAIGGGEIPEWSPTRWAFLDTETTGLAGGSGTYAFLIGVGRITADGFRVRQFFMREHHEEMSLLAALSSHLSEFDVLITYNGKTYDQPLLETRYRMNWLTPPFGRLPHLDLLHGARRIWKLRFENCRLSYLENQILGFEREGDLPGEMIPYVYFEYLRSKEAGRLVPIFHHNAIDILTLGCLTAIVPSAFRGADVDSLERLGLRRGDEMLGVGRWLLAAGECERGLALIERALTRGLRDELAFRALWEIAQVEKKRGGADRALAALTELAGCKNDYRTKSLVELAKHYEHAERNHALALEFTLEALKHGGGGEQGSGARDQGTGLGEELRRRKARLEKRLAAGTGGQGPGVRGRRTLTKARSGWLEPITSAEADAAQ
jgi:uncharacterized protein